MIFLGECADELGDERKMADEEHLIQPPRASPSQYIHHMDTASCVDPYMTHVDSADLLTFPPLHYTQPREASTEKADLELVNLINEML